MSVSQATCEAYISTLPKRPYCTDTLGQRLHIQSREKAVGYAMIQHNSPLVWTWLIFDIDEEDAYFTIEERGCPPPTFIAINRDNGHAHAAYRLLKPVSAFERSGRLPMRYYEDVERGLTRKLGADRAYGGLLSKNPLSARWETSWQAHTPYTLDRLNDYLDKSDKRRYPKGEVHGIGRNCNIFDFVRKIAYKDVLRFKKEGRISDFQDHLKKEAESLNCTFRRMLTHQEVKSIVRSIAKWAWAKFTPERFSAIQACRGKKAWSKTETLRSAEPWKLEGMSRRTWYRRIQSR